MSDALSPPPGAHDRVARRLATDVVIVLVGPQHPGNVGAAARAMKNVGLHRLVVVDPAPSFDLERARWMAPGAGDVLDDMRLVPSLDEALEGVHRAIATTARHRRHGQPVHTTDEVSAHVLDEPEGRVTAILFGREDHGLSNEEALRCESLLRIPTLSHASLNLGQAVLLVGDSFFRAACARGLEPTGRVVGGDRGQHDTRDLDRRGRAPRADLSDLEPAIVELVALLQRVGFTHRRMNPERTGVLLREGLQRAQLDRAQVGALRGMTRRIGYALDHPEIDWTLSRRQREALAAIEDPTEE